MTLVLCPECRAEVSDRAADCPQCGYPITGPQVPAVPDDKTLRPATSISARFAVGWTIAVAAVGVFGFIVARLGVDGVEAAAMVFALSLFASVIPVWWKALRNNPGGGEVERLVEERLREAEEEFRNRLAEMEESGRRVGELEERLEFTERLLTKHRDDQMGSP